MFLTEYSVSPWNNSHCDSRKCYFILTSESNISVLSDINKTTLVCVNKCHLCGPVFLLRANRAVRKKTRVLHVRRTELLPATSENCHFWNKLWALLICAYECACLPNLSLPLFLSYFLSLWVKWEFIPSAMNLAQKERRRSGSRECLAAEWKKNKNCVCFNCQWVDVEGHLKAKFIIKYFTPLSTHRRTHLLSKHVGIKRTEISTTKFSYQLLLALKGW